MIDKKTILSVTHGGLDVFKRYFGADCEKKLFRNPYREDRKASCHLYLHEGHDGLSRFILHDFGDRSWCGDCFAVAAKVHCMERSPFSDVIDMINRDLSLNCQEPFVSSRVPMSEVADWKRKETSHRDIHCQLQEFHLFRVEILGAIRHLHGDAFQVPCQQRSGHLFQA